MNLGFKPTCRYGHGDLVKIDEQGRHPKWGLMSQTGGDVIFSGILFACKTCGYLEMFDDEIELTMTRQSES